MNHIFISSVQSSPASLHISPPNNPDPVLGLRPTTLSFDFSPTEVKRMSRVDKNLQQPLQLQQKTEEHSQQQQQDESQQQREEHQQRQQKNVMEVVSMEVESGPR